MTSQKRVVSALAAYFKTELERTRRELLKASTSFERSTLALQAMTEKQNECYERLIWARDRYDKLQNIVKDYT